SRVAARRCAERQRCASRGWRLTCRLLASHNQLLPPAVRLPVRRSLASIDATPRQCRHEGREDAEGIVSGREPDVDAHIGGSVSGEREPSPGAHVVAGENATGGEPGETLVAPSNGKYRW